MKTPLSSHFDASRGRGRPREFDIDAALDRAIIHFREHGYHGVSITDLSQAMELSAGSIYKAFRSKHALFSASLDRYMALRGQRISKITNGSGSGREKLYALLAFYAESSYAKEGKYGCLVILATVELASTDKEIASKVAAAFHANEQRLKCIVEQGQQDGSIAQTVDPNTIAHFMLALLQGIRVLGKVDQEQHVVMSTIKAAMALLD